jgi:hypothetical protein
VSDTVNNMRNISKHIVITYNSNNKNKISSVKCIVKEVKVYVAINISSKIVYVKYDQKVQGRSVHNDVNKERGITSKQYYSCYVYQHVYRMGVRRGTVQMYGSQLVCAVLLQHLRRRSKRETYVICNARVKIHVRMCNSDRKRPVRKKDPNITESVSMNLPHDDQEMRDLQEKKDSKNHATPTGKRVQVLNISAKKVTIMLPRVYIMYRSRKIRVRSVQSSSWHKDYGE